MGFCIVYTLRMASGLHGHRFGGCILSIFNFNLTTSL
jgi:hypothetical protein